MDNTGSEVGDWPESNASRSYALSGKIMLSAIVILFVVVALMVCLHIYARWYLYRTRRRPHAHAHALARGRRRRTHLVFYMDPSGSVTSPTRGLDASILQSLPVFVYSSKTHTDMPECAVCLSEFEENEKGRRLPKCNHCFHIGCIDMWFHSHATCPLCRSTVDGLSSDSGSRNPADVVISVTETEGGGSASALCSTCQHEEDRTGCLRNSSSVGSSSVGSRRKGSELGGVSIEVPRRNENFGISGDESLLESPATQVAKSPGSRILSLKRILSRDRKSMLSPTSAPGPGVSCGYATEFEADIERGSEDIRHIQTQTQTHPASR